MRNKLITAVNNNSLNMGYLYDFFLLKGGDDLGMGLFQASVNMYLRMLPQPVKVETFYKELLREYKVNLMFDQDKNLIKAY